MCLTTPRMDFEENEKFVYLRCCNKVFYHKECLVQWLENKNECTICKRIIGPNHWLGIGS